MGFGFNRLAQAQLSSLEMITSNVMIADADLNIRYMNAAVTELLTEAEADLRKVLPNFSVHDLVGKNIDVFHKEPSHQRKMVTALKAPNRATIRVGLRAFDLTVMPFGKKGRNTGFVVEWADAKDRIQNLDFAKQLDSIGRVQAIISFTPDGDVIDANHNFLQALGYTLGEVKGRKHRMFVDEAYAGSAAYEQFWAYLRAGKFHAAEFVRFGKNGKRVVINASYNPVFDETGRVTKIVKFATDVTDRVHPVDAIGAALSRLAAGDLCCELFDPFAPDFETMRQNFNQAVLQLKDALGSVSKATRAIDLGSREIGQGAQELSRRTEQQAAALEETAAALDQITANVKNAAARAAEAQHATETAHTSAKSSGEIVNLAIGAMCRIANSSDQISNIIGVIDEIAFQTNLLALNAGVEAARAGEAGKGFAVVAQEVRELAQRSAKAAKDIKELIGKSTEEVRTGVNLVSDTGTALRAIQSNIDVVNTHMKAIASASQEQAIGLSEVNTAVNQMDQVTQQNAAMVEESTAASANLMGEARQLRDLVSQFNLRDYSASDQGFGLPSNGERSARVAA